MPLSRKRLGLAAALSIATVTALVGFAVAKPTKPTVKPKPDAAIENSSDDASVSPSPTTASDTTTPNTVSDAGPVPPPQGMIVPGGDGGVKASPLTPAANEFPGPNVLGDGGVAPDYDKIMGDIAALRSRVAAVGDTLFHSRIAISLETDGSHAKIARLVVSLDDGAIYTAPENFHADDTTAIYTHALSPGHHALTVDLDRKDERNDNFKSSQRSRFIVDVPRDQELAVEIITDDDSNMGKNFPKDQSGKYDLRVRLKVEAKPIKTGK